MPLIELADSAISNGRLLQAPIESGWGLRELIGRSFMYPACADRLTSSLTRKMAASTAKLASLPGSSPNESTEPASR